MVSAKFLLQDSQGKVRFFNENFLLANTNMKVVLKMPFLSFSNANVELAELGKFTWRLYTVTEALPTTSWIKLIGKRKFAKAALDENSKTFIVHVSALKATTIHSSQKAQIAALQWNKALTKILTKYSDYANIFSIDLAMELL